MYVIGGTRPDRLTLNGYSSNMGGCFGVFDGHGGDRASRYCAENLFPKIEAEITAHHASVDDAITSAIHAVDTEFCTIARRMSRPDLDQRAAAFQRGGGAAVPTGRNLRSFGMEDGSTCLIAIIRDGVVHIGNVGDSRAIICTRKGKSVSLSNGTTLMPILRLRVSCDCSTCVLTLTLFCPSLHGATDQKPSRKDERARLEAKGAHVTGSPGFLYYVWPINKLIDVPRVNGALAMSRSIGDLSLKPWITCDPEITTHELTSEDQFLIMATDGLWDVVSSKTAAKIASRFDDPQKAADALVALALAKKTFDNITVVVVDVSSYASNTSNSEQCAQLAPHAPLEAIVDE